MEHCEKARSPYGGKAPGETGPVEVCQTRHEENTSPFSLVFADSAREQEFNDVVTDKLDYLYWLIESDPYPNWRETHPIFDLSMAEGNPTHIAWIIWGGLHHSIQYSIDEERELTVVRGSYVIPYDLSAPDR